MSDRLRIAQIAPIAQPVRAGASDSIEQLVWLLCEELVRRGHEVTLFATGDSQTSAELRSAYDHGYEHDESLWDWRLHESVNASLAFERAAKFDVIHSHAYHFALPFTRLVSTPVVQSCHVEVDPDILAAYRRYPDVCLVAVSDWQRSTLTGVSNVSVIRHGIDTAAFPFRGERGGAGESGEHLPESGEHLPESGEHLPESGEHLLFLGRMIADKGPLQAVRIARMLDLPLVLAGPSSDYFEETVRPLVDNEHVRYVGAVSHEQRNALLCSASALLLPLSYPEPFGLVMIEAMACGTPVVATGIGAVPEIVEPGITGCHAPSARALGDCLAQALALDRAAVRARALERFGFERMVDEHEALYERLVRERGRGGG